MQETTEKIQDGHKCGGPGTGTSESASGLEKSQVEELKEHAQRTEGTSSLLQAQRHDLLERFARLQALRGPVGDVALLLLLELFLAHAHALVDALALLLGRLARRKQCAVGRAYTDAQAC